MTAPFIEVTTGLCVAPQISPEDIERAKAEGFTTIICNRPDGEAIGQPRAADLADAAKAAGISFHSIPVGPGGITPEAVAAWTGILAEGGKVLAYCRSGTRSITLHAFARAAAGMSVQDILSETDAAGYDLEHLEPVLERLHDAAHGNQ